MDYKTLAKSKSSNGAIGTKVDNRNKTSFSNAAFQPSSVGKKRGVYVEKKIQSTTDTQEANNTQHPRKPPRRPRLGQKKFLTSVLTILSKSTTGTQHPDIEDSASGTRTRFKPNCKKTKDSANKTIEKTKKTKYKSRVLNDAMLKSEQEQLIYLQPKKDINQTSSNSSSLVKPASDLTKLPNINEPKRNTIRDILENTIYSGVAEGVTRDVLEEKPKKEKKFRIMDDPETIAADIAKKDDKNMYNFFVDLIETTISVYNVKTDYEISDVSKTAFEIDDSVVKKLEIKKDLHSLDNISYTSKHKTETDAFDITENIPIDVTPSVYRRYSPVKPKIKAKSFLNSNSNTRKAKCAPKSKSFVSNNIRKSTKKEIINLLKEQLQRETYTYNEPDNLYDALKVMAKNKRRNEKSIQFVNKIKDRRSDLDLLDCMFERRNVISFSNKKKNRLLQSKESTSTMLRYNQEYQEDLKSYPVSNHSLEVYGYDYEEPARLPEVKRGKRILLNFDPSLSFSRSTLGDYNQLNSSSSIYSRLIR